MEVLIVKYEVIAGIYKSGADESLEEEMLFETDDLAEAQEFLAELAELSEEDDAIEVDAEEIDDEVPE